MVSVDEILVSLFETLGPLGALLALFLIFVIDAAIFPALPEIAVVLTYSYRPTALDPLLWSVLLLCMAVGGEAVGNSALYLIVRRALIQRGRMPKAVERLMHRWIDFLVLHDERIILLNRIAPVVPLVGAFIATCRWDYRKSLAYIVSGAAAKYVVLLALIAGVGFVYDPGTARWVSLGLVLVIVAVSILASVVYRRRAGLSPRRTG